MDRVTLVEAGLVSAMCPCLAIQRYGMMLAENEAANPWQLLHVELGFCGDQNVVTVV